MKQLPFIFSVLMLASGWSAAALPAGSQAPDFELQASQAGHVFKYALHDALKRGTAVVYFFPAAFTQGCNVQAHVFAERVKDFEAAGASIVGVSLDNIERLNRFSADPAYCAGKIPVASDASGSVARLYDLHIRSVPTDRKDTQGNDIGHDAAERTTFIIAPGGKILATVGDLPADTNVERALEIVKSFSQNKEKL